MHNKASCPGRRSCVAGIQSAVGTGHGSGRRQASRRAGAARRSGRRRGGAVVWRERRPQRAPMSLFFKFRSSRSSSGAAAACGMECGVAAPAAARPALAPPERSPAKSGLHVNFTDKGEVKERREKFLTAKYGSHQMALIRKRLAVEMWLYDELQKLYEPPHSESGAGAGVVGGQEAREVEVDIDELLDMDSDAHRREHLAKLLADAKKPVRDVNFINELLEKAKTL